jgi:hypothetical protein
MGTWKWIQEFIYIQGIFPNRLLLFKKKTEAATFCCYRIIQQTVLLGVTKGTVKVISIKLNDPYASVDSTLSICFMRKLRCLQILLSLRFLVSPREMHCVLMARWKEHLL